MYWLLLAIPIGLIVSFVVWIILNMIFVAQITDIKVFFSKEITILIPGIAVKELEHGNKPLPATGYNQTDSGAMPSAKTMLLTPDGQLVEGQRVYDDDPNVEVDYLEANGVNLPKIFLKNDIYAVDGDRLGRKLGEFSNPAFKVFRYAGALNEKYFLVVADAETATYVDDVLWQVRHEDFEKTIIESDPYYTFERVPKVFKPGGFDGTLLVIYSGDLSYGFGGDSSRPKFSILRAYTGKHPDGIDLVRLGFKAGTIVDIEWRDGSLILVCDPSRPSSTNKQRLPSRQWQVHLPDTII
ncbi:MAG: hypothetical protein V4732_08095 [Pseudomonadota bacterium]